MVHAKALAKSRKEVEGSSGEKPTFLGLPANLPLRQSYDSVRHHCPPVFAGRRLGCGGRGGTCDSRCHSSHFGTMRQDTLTPQ